MKKTLLSFHSQMLRPIVTVQPCAQVGFDDHRDLFQPGLLCGQVPAQTEWLHLNGFWGVITGKLQPLDLGIIWDKANWSRPEAFSG